MQAEIVDAYERGGFPSLVIDSKKDYVERFGGNSDVRTGNLQSQDEFGNAYGGMHIGHGIVGVTVFNAIGLGQLLKLVDG